MVACCARERGLKPHRCDLCLWAAVLFALSLASLVGAIFAAWYLSGVLIKLAIERFDVSFIGTQVSVGTLHFNPFNGRFEASDVVVANPPGYLSEYLLKVGTLAFKLDMAPLVLSLGRHVTVNDVLLQHADVIYERSRARANFDTVLAHVASWLDSESSLLATRRVEALDIHRVEVLDIHAKATSTLLAGVGLGLTVGDIRFADFTREVGPRGAGDVVAAVLLAILRSALKALGAA